MKFKQLQKMVDIIYDLYGCEIGDTVTWNEAVSIINREDLYVCVSDIGQSVSAVQCKEDTDLYTDYRNENTRYNTVYKTMTIKEYILFP